MKAFTGLEHHNEDPASHLGLHENDRKMLAKNLGLNLSTFDRLVDSANYAYQVIKNLGPFYGREDVVEPTFRITAEPVKLPKAFKKSFGELGNNLFLLGKALQKLPDELKDNLGQGLDFRIPPTWRIDVILDDAKHMWVNEVEGVDSASALMIAEQLAYELQNIEDSTAAHLSKTFLKMGSSLKKATHHKFALIRANTAFDPHLVNHKRLLEFIKKLSNKKVTFDLYDEGDLRMGASKPDWSIYSGVINETPLSPKELKSLGIKEEQLLSVGNYNAIGNKGVFALIHDPKLEDFWNKEIGEKVLQNLRSLLVPTSFIETLEDLNEAREANKVVKVSWAGANTTLINRSKGVAMPEGEIEQGTNERWEYLRELLENGVKLISQEYIRPAKVKAFLRKKSTNLEPVEWYNRICMKYVCSGHPHLDDMSEVILTAIEATLGPDIIPAGRKCAFTAAAFEE